MLQPKQNKTSLKMPFTLVLFLLLLFLVLILQTRYTEYMDQFLGRQKHCGLPTRILGVKSLLNNAPMALVDTQ